MKQRVLVSIVALVVGVFVFPLDRRAQADAPPTVTFADINPDRGDSIVGIAGQSPGDGPYKAPCLSQCPGGGSGGRVNGLTFISDRPNVVYGASEFGGLFKSLDAGRTWFHVDGHLPTRTWDVAVSITRPLPDERIETVYATSWDDYRQPTLSGIQISRDDGATWSRTAIPEATLPCAGGRGDRPQGFGISIRPSVPSQVLISTDCGIARTDDVGSTWTYIDPTPDDGELRRIWSVVVDADGLTYACGDEGIFSSANGATNWAALTSPSGLVGRCSLAMAPFESQVVFLTVGNRYFQSDDGGQNWDEFDAVDPGGAKGRVPFVKTNLRSACFGCDSVGVTYDLWMGDGDLWRVPCSSTAKPRCPKSRSQWAGTFSDSSGGPTKAHGDSGTVAFDPTTDCPVLYSSDGGIYRNAKTNDCHNPDFQDANVGLHAQWLWGMAGFARPGGSEDLFIAMQDNGFFATDDGGVPEPTWRQYIGADAFDTATDGANTFATHCCGDLTRGGASYVNPKLVNDPAPTGWRDANYADVLDTWAPGRFVMATFDGIFVTADAGADPIPWNELPDLPTTNQPCAVRAGERSDVVVLYVMTGDCGYMARSELWRLIALPFGATPWERVDDNAGPDGFGIFAVDRSDPTRLYASLMSNPPVMVRSNDGGNTWTEDQGLTDMMDRGGIFERRPTLVAFDPNDPQVLVAGGEESGVVLSSDNGQTWAPLTDPFTPDVFTPHLPRPFFAHFEPGEPRRIYIGTNGRGIWRIGQASADLRIDVNIIRICVRAKCAPDPCLTCPIAPGEVFSIVIQPVNVGPAVAGNPVVRQVLPPGLQFRSLSAPRPWSCRTPAVGSPGVVSCDGPDLQPRGAEEPRGPIRLEVQVARDIPEGTTLRSPVRIGSNAIDSEPDDNGVELANRVTRLADLALSAEASPARVYVGRPTALRFTVENLGPQNATGVVFDDTLPDGLELRRVETTAGTCTAAGNAVTCGLGQLEVGESTSVVIDALARSPGELANQAVVRAAEEDPNPTDSTIATPVVVLEDLTPPELQLQRPRRGVHASNRELIGIGIGPVISVGRLTIQATVDDPESGIEQFRFEVDDVPVEPSRVFFDAPTHTYTFLFEPDTSGLYTVSGYARNGASATREEALDVLIVNV